MLKVSAIAARISKYLGITMKMIIHFMNMSTAASFLVVENAPINVLKAGYDGFFEGLFVHRHLYEDFW